MTHEQCRHFTVDGSAYCDRCKDEWYLDSVFEMNGHVYQVWQFFGFTESGDSMYIVRRMDGSGTIYLDTAAIDERLGQKPYWLPQPCHHDEY